MFTVRPYPQIASIETYWNGADTQTGSPAALEIADSFVFIDSKPFADADGVPTTLLPEEKAALATTCVGMKESTTQARLGEWFDNPVGSVTSLYKKLGAGGQRAGIATVSLAYEKGVLLPHTPPRLTGIRKEYHQRFVELVPMLGTRYNHGKVSEALGVRTGTIYQSLGAMAADLGIGEIEQPAQTLVALAGASELLPRYTDPIDLRTLLRPDFSDQEERLFPPAPTKSIWLQPFESDPYTLIRFSGQPTDGVKPDVHVGGIDRLWTENAVVDVCNPFIDESKTRKLFTPRELSVFVFCCMGLSPPQAAAMTAVRGKGSPLPLLNVYNALLPATNKPARSRSVEQAVHAAFEKKIFISRRAPELHYLSEFWLNKLFTIMPLVSEGMTDREIGQKLGWCTGTVGLDLTRLRKKTAKDTPTLVLLAEAHNVTHPLAETEVQYGADLAHAA